jgi:hypothetical protein
MYVGVRGFVLLHQSPSNNFLYSPAKYRRQHLPRHRRHLDQFVSRKRRLPALV